MGLIMKIIDVLKKGAELGKFPKVEVDHDINHAKSRFGTITSIRHGGISVRVEGLWKDVWFFDNPDGKDKRIKYMHQLKFVD